MATLIPSLLPKKGLSGADYFNLPTEGPRTELGFGEILETPRPTDRHNEFTAGLGTVLRTWVRDCKLGKIFLNVDRILDEAAGLVVRPDLNFLSVEHSDRNPFPLRLPSPSGAKTRPLPRSRHSLGLVGPSRGPQSAYPGTGIAGREVPGTLRRRRGRMV